MNRLSKTHAAQSWLGAPLLALLLSAGLAACSGNSRPSEPEISDSQIPSPAELPPIQVQVADGGANEGANEGAEPEFIESPREENRSETQQPEEPRPKFLEQSIEPTRPTEPQQPVVQEAPIDRPKPILERKIEEQSPKMVSPPIESRPKPSAPVGVKPPSPQPLPPAPARPVPAPPVPAPPVSAPSVSAPQPTLNEAIDRLYREMVSKASGSGHYSMPDLELFQIALKSHCSLLEKHSQSASMRSDRFAWVDYTQPSSQKRLYLFDLKGRKLLHQTHATHGKGSIPEVALSVRTGSGRNQSSQDLSLRTSDREARFFSNRNNSNQSTLGAAVADSSPYHSKTFESQALRMKGLDGDLNSKILSRAIVFHAWDYREQEAGMGRLPLSQGCLMFPRSDLFEGASRVDVNTRMIEALRSVPVYLYHQRLLDAQLNDQEYAADLLEYEALQAELAREIPFHDLQGRTGELETQLKEQWLDKAEETYQYFKKGSLFIGREPQKTDQCLALIRSSEA